MKDSKIKRELIKSFKKHRLENISIKLNEKIVFLEGTIDSYEKYIIAGHLAGRNSIIRGVVNNISYPEKKKTQKKKGKDEFIGSADVVIVGGGITGCSIARELSKYKLKIVIIEKDEDVSCGATKANNAMVHSGIGEEPGTLKQKLCVQGHFLFEKLSKQLSVPYRQCGMLIVITKDSLEDLKLPSFLSNFLAKYVIPYIILRRGKKIKVPLEKISRMKILEIEPQLTDRTILGISSPTYGVTSPYEFCIALAENAVENGVDIRLNTEVVGIELEENRIRNVITTEGKIRTGWVINAAGVNADEIAEVAKDRFYTIHPRKGSTLLFDKSNAGYISHNLSFFQFPMKEHTKGGGAMVTTHGNIQWGPTAIEIPDKDDLSVSKDEIYDIFEKYSRLLPNFSKKSIIAYFAGIRSATFTEDFIIEASKKIKGLIHVAGIQSPGIAASPAIAMMVADILKNEGLTLTDNPKFEPLRKNHLIIRELDFEKRKKIIEKNPLYGRIVCRCEEVTEGEIVDAIHSNIPAKSLDAIKRRTRAGMGRCQAGFCLPRVAKILSRETGKPIEKIMKNSKESQLFIGKSKCLLEETDGD
ncbi:MAG: NAD(P)/FAD-dependent oxidoreductase [Candidatus Thermoplasmatota archaeon]|nr:NAD(P)/FAD-dependent oxidoreductase [Candidatus Thermoplasmatota archaeon]